MPLIACPYIYENPDDRWLIQLYPEHSELFEGFSKRPKNCSGAERVESVGLPFPADLILLSSRFILCALDPSCAHTPTCVHAHNTHNFRNSKHTPECVRSQVTPGLPVCSQNSPSRLYPVKQQRLSQVTASNRNPNLSGPTVSFDGWSITLYLEW